MGRDYRCCYLSLIHYDSVKDWPIIGEKTHAVWLQASDNLEATLKRYDEETKEVEKAIVSSAAGAAGAILQFMLSIIISGILVANASAAYDVTVKFFTRLTIDKEYSIVITSEARTSVR